MRKTKIVCTLGPACSDIDTIRQLMLAGMNVARFNFSHADHNAHKDLFEKLLVVREELKMPVASLLDTKGPEVRVGKMKDGKVTLIQGNSFILTTDEMEGTSEKCTISYKDLPKDVKPGTSIMLDNGLIALEVNKIEGNDIYCTICNGGELSDHKGVNIPNTTLSMPYVSEKDRDDIIFGIEMGYDFIAASFSRTADDILQIRRILEEYKCNSINIIAKIENAEGVLNVDEILKVADGLMVARGDMGVEIALEEIPVIQKQLIKKAYNAGKQVITATQMLESMMVNPRPTRAETNDVANAIYDGTSAIMLSGETAAGKYPVESVKTMARIAERTERDIDYVKRFRTRDADEQNTVTSAISHATCTTGHDLGAAAIITVTKSGQTARAISKYRPKCPIIGCTTSQNICRQLNLSWGVYPILVDEQTNTDQLFDHAVARAVQEGLVNNGDLVVITAGAPLGISGTTNLLKVHIVGDVLVSGKGVNQHSLCARLCVCSTEEEALERFTDGDILVIPATSNRLLGIIKKASGIVTEEMGVNSHAAIVGLTLDIPVIVGATNATKILKNGSTAVLDSARGQVCSGHK